MLEVRLCKPAIYKLKILGGGKFEYYKSMGQPQKVGVGGGGDRIFKVQWGESKKGGHDFWLKFSVGELGGNYETINYFENFIKTLIKSFSAKSAA